MQNTTRCAAVAAVLAFVATPVLGEAVSDDSFDKEAQTLAEELQRHDEVGVFGRAGDIADEAAAPTTAVTDRDLDRYVVRLGQELRMRNAIADRGAPGVQ